MVQTEPLELKKLSQFCARRAPVLIHPSLYRGLKLTFHTDVSGIVAEGRITSDKDTGSLEQSVGFLTPDRFSSSLCLRDSHLKDVY